MNKKGPIIVIEDDLDDQALLSDALKDLKYDNEIRYFVSGEAVLTYLNNTKERPFIILSDINMPELSGLELRNKIFEHENLRMKCIPYLFFTIAASQNAVVNAYSKSAQGFFVKPASYEKLLIMLRKIIDYWQECRSPNYIE